MRSQVVRLAKAWPTCWSSSRDMFTQVTAARSSGAMGGVGGGGQKRSSWTVGEEGEEGKKKT